MTHTINVNFTTSDRMRKHNDAPIEYHLYKVKDYVKMLTWDFQYHGYLYLNQVYERLGVKWNPCDANAVFINDYCNGTLRFIVSDPVKVDGFDTIVVTIEYNDT